MKTKEEQQEKQSMEQASESLSFEELRFLYRYFNSPDNSDISKDFKEKLYRLAVEAWKRENPGSKSFLM